MKSLETQICPFENSDWQTCVHSDYANGQMVWIIKTTADNGHVSYLACSDITVKTNVKAFYNNIRYIIKKANYTEGAGLSGCGLSCHPNEK